MIRSEIRSISDRGAELRIPPGQYRTVHYAHVAHRPRRRSFIPWFFHRRSPAVEVRTSTFIDSSFPLAQ